MTEGKPISVQATTPHAVSTGDWIRYAVSASGTSPNIDPVIFTMDWFEFDFIAVNNSEVTTLFTVRYLNGTEDTMNFSWDVLSGEEIWLIPAELQTGDIIPWEYTMINATVTRSYLGVSRSVNMVELLYQDGNYTEQMWFYWDQATGLLMELTLEIHDDSEISMFQYLAIERARKSRLSLSLQLPVTTVIQGEVVSLSVLLTDTDGRLVDNASIQATVDATMESLTTLGNGKYQLTLVTSSMTIGRYNVTMRAQKAGYIAAQSSFILTVVPIQLTVTPQLSTEQVSPGSTVTISAIVSDTMNTSVTGASVTATYNNISTHLIDLGDGTYQGILEIMPLPEGSYSIQVTAQKLGYPLAQAVASITLTSPSISWLPYLGIAGILGSVGTGVLYRYRKRTRSL